MGPEVNRIFYVLNKKLGPFFFFKFTVSNNDCGQAVYDKALESSEEAIDFDEDLIDLDALLDDDDAFMNI